MEQLASTPKDTQGDSIMEDRQEEAPPIKTPRTEDCLSVRSASGSATTSAAGAAMVGAPDWAQALFNQMT
eukprot:8912392-Prorocentrum_lima.AAC.1